MRHSSTCRRGDLNQGDTAAEGSLVPRRRYDVGVTDDVRHIDWG